MSTRLLHDDPPARPQRVRVRVEQPDADPSEFAFTSSFRVGRGMECELRIDSGLVSRLHAKVILEEGDWWVHDAGSTNGIYIDGKQTPKARLDAALTVQLGRNAPTLYLALEDADGRATLPPPRQRSRPGEPQSATRRAQTFRQGTAAKADPDTLDQGGFVARLPGSPGGAPVDPSVSQVIRRYFDDDPSRPAGEHTMMIRKAYAKVKKQEKRKYTGVIAGALGLLLIATGFIIYQELQLRRLKEQAVTFFQQVKEGELQMAELQYRLMEDPAFAQRIAEQEQQRRQKRQAYEGYVEELGLYRKLNDEEKLIYQVARIFNESEFEMPAGFVREVRSVMHNYWLSPAGKRGYARIIRQAEEKGYTEHIVETMRRYGLPPEFFYLALQESRVDTSAVGPPTRWGIAKGMWQFIPSTARRYGLRTGPREDVRTVDPLDERHHFEKATEAAAKYLLYIFSTPAQASGLLVMASYNWGEHRVIKKLQSLPTSQGAIDALFEGLDKNVDTRNYWRFLVEYEDRMPEETKDYVLKIFAAAVVGQDPRRYGFDFDNPLKRYLETPLAQAD